MKQKHLLTSDTKLALFGYGEWVEEPDECTFKHAGFKCEVIRNLQFGNWLGYLVLPREHPWYGLHYDDIDAVVHGGLTYGKCDENDTWAIGFDCAHTWDIVPMHQIYPVLVKFYQAHRSAEYRTRSSWIRIQTSSVLSEKRRRVHFFQRWQM